jgi:Fe-S cluster biogenesis protein NfuA
MTTGTGEALSGRTVRERVEEALARCRPFLLKDEGDVELAGIGDDGVVEVRFQGTCTICPMSKMTLRAGIERAILRNAPEVKRVELVK